MKTLIAITGPTGVGKTDVAIELAESLHTEIISADSRQVYADIPIISAAPTPLERARVPHHFVGILPPEAYFSAALFEQQAMETLTGLFRTTDTVVLCGGSMLYVDSLCHGIDQLPTISPGVREKVARMAASEGLPGMLSMLEKLDPAYHDIVDKANLKRIAHAIEICLESGTTYTSLRTGRRRERPFRLLKYCLNAPRPILFDRINSRVEKMLEQGMIEEARRLYPLRHLNSLNTVGCKEMFEYISGNWDLPFAIARMQKNTRVYAKKQLTWYARDPEICTLDITTFHTPSHIAETIAEDL